jgi:hypothetical protein
LIHRAVREQVEQLTDRVGHHQIQQLENATGEDAEDRDRFVVSVVFNNVCELRHDKTMSSI